MRGAITGAIGLTDDGGLVLQLSIADTGQVDDLRAWVQGTGWLPWRAIVRGATWQTPHPITTPATVTAVFGHGCHRARYSGKVDARAGGRWAGWQTVAAFDWSPGTPSARLAPSLPAPRIRRARQPQPARPRQRDRLGRLLGWLDKIGG